MLKIGDKAPAWSGIDHRGVLHASSGIQPRPTLLYFYPKDDTPGCTMQACGIRDVYPELSAAARVIGVSADSLSSHEKFASKYSLPFPLIADTDRTMITAFGVDGVTLPKRTTFLIDVHGVIRKMYLGFDCSQHAAMVLQDVRSASL